MKKNVKQKLNEYRCDNLTLHFIETDYDGRNYYYDDNGEHYVGRGGTPEHPLYLTTAYGDGWEPDLEVECDNVNVLMESKRKIKRINESQLKTIIAESVKMVLKENDFVNGKLNPFQSPEVRQSINARHQTKSTCGNRNKVQVTNTVKPNGMPLNGTAKKYFYSKEEAEQMGYKPTGWADISGWIYQNEKGDVVHVKRDWSRIKIKESKLKTIVSESIKKVLRESYISNRLNGLISECIEEMEYFGYHHEAALLDEWVNKYSPSIAQLQNLLKQTITDAKQKIKGEAQNWDDFDDFISLMEEILQSSYYEDNGEPWPEERDYMDTSDISNDEFRNDYRTQAKQFANGWVEAQNISAYMDDRARKDKRNAKDNFRRGMKSADKRPLHRKDSLNRDI